MTAELEVPLRTCEPWCVNGEGHPTEHPTDRFCTEFMPLVPLSLHEAIKMCDGDWSRDWIDVHLRRPPQAHSPQVWISWETEPKGVEIRLTLEEAARLRDVLTQAIELTQAR